MTSLVTDLLCCPFCGGTRIKTGIVSDGLRVVCQGCGGSGGSEFYVPESIPPCHDRAIAKWNARAALTGEGWRGMDSAPKDGTKIILAKIIPASEEREAAIWWACMGHWRVESPLSGTAGKIRRQAAWTDGMDNLGDPTHWTPVLPPPPPPTE